MPRRREDTHSKIKEQHIFGEVLVTFMFQVIKAQTTTGTWHLSVWIESPSPFQHALIHQTDKGN